jgi:hypothetical protein
MQFLKKNGQVITKAGISDVSFFTEQYLFPDFATGTPYEFSLPFK